VARTANGGLNKSASIRELYTQNPQIQVKDVISTLAAKGIKVAPNLVYLVKGKMKGEKKRTPKTVTAGAQFSAGPVTAKSAAKSGGSNAVATIGKIKSLAGEVGGLKTLKALVDALAD
jgi:hypothetical protein